MDKYEYKFVEIPMTIGFDQTRKIRDMEALWNSLGQEGWMFCKEGNGCVIFTRKI